MRSSGRWSCEAPPAMRLACVVEAQTARDPFPGDLARRMEAWPDVAASWHLVAPRPGEALVGLQDVLRAAWSARAALRRASPDALLFHTHEPALLCPDYLRRLPGVFSIDATPRQKARLAGARRAGIGGAARQVSERWSRWSLPRAGRVVVWSDWAGQALAAEYGVPARRIEVLPPGIDVERWAPQAEGVASPRRVPRIVLLGEGRDVSWKQGILPFFRRHWQGRAELHAVTATPLLPDRGVFLHREALHDEEARRALLRDADVLLLPHCRAPFPHPVVEAMALGVPVVAGAVGAVPEVVAHGETGFLVDRGDPQEAFAATEALLQDGDLRRRMGRAARERARECHDVARNGRRLVAALRRACEEAAC